MRMYFCFVVGFHFEEDDECHDSLQNGKRKNKGEFQHREESYQQKESFEQNRGQ